MIMKRITVVPTKSNISEVGMKKGFPYIYLAIRANNFLKNVIFDCTCIWIRIHEKERTFMNEIVTVLIIVIV